MQLYFLVLLSAFLAIVRGQGCGFVGTDNTTIIITPFVSELHAPETVFAMLETFGVEGTATIVHPYNRYVSARRYPSGIYELLTSAEFPDFINIERDTFIPRSARFTCTDGTAQVINFEINVKDENNHAPTFNEDVYNAVIELPLAPPGRIELGIIVSDADLLFSNADVHITSNNSMFRPEITRLWEEGVTPAVYQYRVDFLVNPDIHRGLYTVGLLADDGGQFNTAIMVVDVFHIETPETEATEPYTTTTTTMPTTFWPCGPLHKCTEIPSTTTPPTTTEDTTTIRMSTTTEGSTDEPLRCGIVGLNPGIVEVVEQPGDLPAATEIWRGELFNVLTTGAVTHPHNKYLQAFKQGVEYRIETSTEYPNFHEVENSTILQRNVNLYCEDDNVVQYQFRIPVQLEI